VGRRVSTAYGPWDDGGIYEDDALDESYEPHANERPEDDYDPYLDDPDHYRDDPEPPEDYLIEEAERHAQHPWAHARPGLVRRLAARLTRPRLAGVRIGPVELTIRMRRGGPCGACAGRGWFYTKGMLDPVPMPDGYDGVALCGCGTAIARLAERQRSERRSRRQSRREPPF
jgi:hypothetical protein